jgi:ribonuclease HI
MNKFNTTITKLLKEEQTSLHMQSFMAMAEALERIAERIDDDTILDEDSQYLYGAAEELKEFVNLYS